MEWFLFQRHLPSGSFQVIKVIDFSHQELLLAVWKSVSSIIFLLWRRKLVRFVQRKRERWPLSLVRLVVGLLAAARPTPPLLSSPVYFDLQLWVNPQGSLAHCSTELSQIQSGLEEKLKFGKTGCCVHPLSLSVSLLTVKILSLPHQNMHMLLDYTTVKRSSATEVTALSSHQFREKCGCSRKWLTCQNYFRQFDTYRTFSIVCKIVTSGNKKTVKAVYLRVHCERHLSKQ